jgi:hypothetical protein
MDSDNEYDLKSINPSTAIPNSDNSQNSNSDYSSVNSENQSLKNFEEISQIDEGEEELDDESNYSDEDDEDDEEDGEENKEKEKEIKPFLKNISKELSLSNEKTKPKKQIENKLNKLNKMNKIEEKISIVSKSIENDPTELMKSNIHIESPLIIKQSISINEVKDEIKDKNKLVGLESIESSREEWELPEKVQKNGLKDGLLKGNFRDKRIVQVLKESNTFIMKNYWGILLQSYKIKLDLSSLCYHFPNSIFHHEKNMLSIELENPCCLFTITQKGKIIISGCNSKETLILGTKKFVYLLNEAGFLNIQYKEPTCLNIMGLISIEISNIQDKTLIKIPKIKNDQYMIDLENLYKTIGKFESRLKNTLDNSIIKMKLFNPIEKDEDAIIIECNAPTKNMKESTKQQQSSIGLPLILMIITKNGKIGMYLKSFTMEFISFEKLERFHLWIMNHLFEFLYKDKKPKIKQILINDQGFIKELIN